jgi:hypothetical protein
MQDWLILFLVLVVVAVVAIIIRVSRPRRGGPKAQT